MEFLPPSHSHISHLPAPPCMLWLSKLHVSFGLGAGAMIQELLRLTGRAAGDPDFLAYHFQDINVATICRRLSCSVLTALLVELSATPNLESWRTDVEALATIRGVNADDLAALLRDAEALRFRPPSRREAQPPALS